MWLSMRFRLAVCLMLVPVLGRADWKLFRSGPFEILTESNERDARQVLAQLDQVRYLVGANLTRPEPNTIGPIRVLVFKSPQPGPAVPALARDAYLAGVSGPSLPPPMMREVVRLLIESNAGRMPAPIERGLADFFATAQVAATKITLGAPPAPPTLDWARIDLLVTNPEYAGTSKLRVLLYNLQQGADPDPSFRNGFGKSAAQIEKEASAWLAAGNFPTITISGRPLNPLRDYIARSVDPARVSAALADLKLVSGDGAQAAYLDLRNQAPAAAHEGLGLLAEKAGRNDEARQEFEAAFAADGASARAWLEDARLNPDPLKAAAALQKAAELNPNWSEPYVLLAERESDPSRKLNWFKKAAELEPRNAERWRAVAELYQTHHKYPEAAKAWAAAENASVDDAERRRMVEARRGIDEKRLEYQAAERRRQDDERQRELQKVKDASMAEIRAAEERANRANQPASPVGKVVPWWGGGDAPSGKVEGTLGRIECIGRVLRLVIRSADGRQTRLAIHDPAKIVIVGGGQASLKCGPQSPARTIIAEYFAKPDAKLGTAGELASIEYQ